MHANHYKILSTNSFGLYHWKNKTLHFYYSELEDMQSYMKNLDTERSELWEQLNTQENDLKV